MKECMAAATPGCDARSVAFERLQHAFASAVRASVRISVDAYGSCSSVSSRTTPLGKACGQPRTAGLLVSTASAFAAATGTDSRPADVRHNSLTSTSVRGRARMLAAERPVSTDCPNRDLLRCHGSGTPCLHPCEPHCRMYRWCWITKHAEGSTPLHIRGCPVLQELRKWLCCTCAGR
jgi:hypothetical protein